MDDIDYKLSSRNSSNLFLVNVEQSGDTTLDFSAATKEAGFANDGSKLVLYGGLSSLIGQPHIQSEACP